MLIIYLKKCNLFMLLQSNSSVFKEIQEVKPLIDRKKKQIMIPNFSFLMQVVKCKKTSTDFYRCFIYFFFFFLINPCRSYLYHNMKNVAQWSIYHVATDICSHALLHKTVNFVRRLPDRRNHQLTSFIGSPALHCGQLHQIIFLYSSTCQRRVLIC